MPAKSRGVWALATTSVALPAQIALAAGACDSTFRFDEHDAAETVDATAAVEVAGSTAWTGIETCATSCNLSCPGPRTCVGSCDSACTATCPPGSDCTLSAARDTTITCDSARCAATILDRSVLHCQGTASCDLICPRDCSLDCGASARCTIKCAADPAPRSVTGLVACSEA